MVVRPEYLQASIDAACASHGNVAAYITAADGLGLTPTVLCIAASLFGQNGMMLLDIKQALPDWTGSFVGVQRIGQAYRSLHRQTDRVSDSIAEMIPSAPSRLRQR